MARVQGLCVTRESSAREVRTDILVYIQGAHASPPTPFRMCGAMGRAFAMDGRVVDFSAAGVFIASQDFFIFLLIHVSFLSGLCGLVPLPSRA